jgi:hypothetical protein
MTSLFIFELLCIRNIIDGANFFRFQTTLAYLLVTFLEGKWPLHLPQHKGGVSEHDALLVKVSSSEYSSEIRRLDGCPWGAAQYLPGSLWVCITSAIAVL